MMKLIFQPHLYYTLCIYTSFYIHFLILYWYNPYKCGMCELLPADVRYLI